MIVRNEGRTLEKCLRSVAPHVDEIVIGLAGESTDNTEEIARQFTNKVINVPWTDDFAAARNAVLAHQTGDYVLWLDGDDELINGSKMRSLIADFPQIEAFYWGYDYARDADSGATTCYLVRERLVRRNGRFAWKGPIHEVLMGPADHTRMFVSDILVVHHKPEDKHDSRRNLEILYRQLEVSEPNPDPRILAYLGSENAIRGNLQESILHRQRYIRLSNWDEERYQVTHHLADTYRVLGDYDKALKYDFEAIDILPEWPDAYLGLGETNYARGKYQAAIEWMKAASTKQVPQTMLITNPRDYDYTPSVIIALAYAQLGDYEMSLANALRAYQINPTPELRRHIDLVRAELDGHRLVDAVKTIWEHLGRNDEWLKARHLWDSIPKLVEQVPAIQDLRAKTLDWTAHVDEPELMRERYVNNENWTPMSDEEILDPEFLNYPRMAFALRVARETDAKSILDFGCSDGFIALPLARELGKTSVSGMDLDPRCIQLAEQRVRKWELPNAGFFVGDVMQYKSDVEKFYDLGLAFELIEHVVDPDEFLTNLERSARHIALTTPYLAWGKGREAGWDVPELKPHLRIFDTDDMERMLAPRGRIYNLYRQPWSDTGWIFADYRPGEQTTTSIAIAAMGTPEDWSPREFESSGLGGSETAVIRLSEELANSGAAVTVFGRIDDDQFYRRVRYRRQERFLPAVHHDIFVAWRSPELIDLAPNASLRVLWLHDTDRGESLTPERAAKFDKIICLTQWHKNHLLETYPFLPAEKLVIIPNGVDVERFNDLVKRDPYRVIYSSSPDRGLDIILEHIWPKVVAKVPQATLHTYYGWNNYDKFLHLPGMREYREKVMNLLNSSRGVVQHGRVSQKELAKAFQESAVWLYPTYFTETYCITAVEAQMGGAIPVTNRLAALNETVVSGIDIPGDVHDPQVQASYASAVIDLLGRDDLEPVHQSIRFSAPDFSWASVAEMWLRDVIGDTHARD
jgi:glycosyltransferase involved in cell wall biosynthesis